MDDPLPDLIDLVRTRTPARLLVGRSGSSYRTATQLELREDHAAARDAVQSEFDLIRDLGADLVNHLGIFEARSQARNKAEYLLRPDLGRKLDPASADLIRQRCPGGQDIQLVIGDGLSPRAVAAQVPRLLPLLEAEANARRWSTGVPVAIRYCRVGIMNEIGTIVDPRVVILLIGERPGLATSESLSAYMAYRPRMGQTDAHRNLISNIHERGTSPEEAVGRILDLAAQMMASKTSGVSIKETSKSIQEGRPGD